MQIEKLIAYFFRHIDYLRISVTDHCDERCRYWMLETYKGWVRGKTIWRHKVEVFDTVSTHKAWFENELEPLKEYTPLDVQTKWVGNVYL